MLSRPSLVDLPQMSISDLFHLRLLYFVEKESQQFALFLGMLLSKNVHLGQLPMDERRPFDILFIDQVHELKEKHSSVGMCQERHYLRITLSIRCVVTVTRKREREMISASVDERDRISAG